MQGNIKKIKKMTSDLDKRESRTAFFFILIPLTGFVLFTLISLIISAYYSITNFNPINVNYRVVWFENYKALFTNQVFAPAFKEAIINTLWLLLSLPLGLVVSIVIAAFMTDKGFKSRGVMQAIIYLPAVTSVVAINFIWRFMFEEDGIINIVFGIDKKWLVDFSLVKVAMIIKNVWCSIGTSVILFMAGMQNISNDYYEAADLDGANAIRKFFNITLPLITPVLFYSIITGLIGGLQTYTDVQLFAGGNLGARTIVYFIWDRGIGQNRYGLASAASLLLAFVIMIITVAQFKLSKWVDEGEG